MPAIQEYDSKVASAGFQPTETGIQATAQAARRIGASYRETGQEIGQAIQQVGTQAGNYWAHREISKGAAEFSTFMAKTTDDWNNVVKNADPNDPTLKQKFGEMLNEKLTDFQNTFVTAGAREWSERSIDSFRNHMSEKMSADMASLAADAVTVNAKQAANAATLRARSDPTAITEILGENERIVDGLINSSVNLKGAAASRVRENLLFQMNEASVKASWIGKADRNPAAAIEELNKLDPNSPEAKYIKSDEVTQIIRYAERQQKLDRLTDLQAKREVKAAAKEAADGFITDGIIKMIQPDGSMKGGADFLKALRNAGPKLEGASPGLLESVIGFAQRVDRKAAADTPGVMRELLDNIALPDGDPNKTTQAKVLELINAEGDRHISPTTAKFVLSQINPDGEKISKTRSEFTKRYESVVDSAYGNQGIKSALGQIAMQRMEVDMLKAEEELRKQGKNPASLYDPSSKDFFGNRISNYRVSLQDAMKFNEADSKGKAVLPKFGKNLTGDDRDSNVDAVITIPKDMSIEDAVKKYGSGTVVVAPNGKRKVLP